jgi:hypothetical protein
VTGRALAVLAVLFYIAHAIVHLRRGEPYDLLWGCHLAVLLVASGLLLRNATLNAVGLLWACFGLPIWLIYTFTGGEFMPTATLTHFGALVIGLLGVRLLGFPRGSAWKALAGYLGLWAVTRVLTPASANVNLAFHVHPGWEQPFGSYPVYFATLLAAGALTFVAAEQVFRHIPRSGGRPPASG